MPLTKANHNNLHLVDGKAASLGEMLAAKTHVPSGFVISTAASYEGMTEPEENEFCIVLNKYAWP
jgi:phosphoenolpyruvate synthase/pyruvate phosphate dikinase